MRDERPVPGAAGRGRLQLRARFVRPQPRTAPDAPVILATESFPKEAFEQWMGVLDNPHVAGDFVWTAMDYLGEVNIGYVNFDDEPNPGAGRSTALTAATSTSCGVKHRSHIIATSSGAAASSRWPCIVRCPTAARSSVHVWGWPDEERSWTWPGHEGKPMQVSVYAPGGEVHLTLNGHQIGQKAVSRETKFTATFEAPYEPGELTAETIEGGKVVARQSLRTAGTHGQAAPAGRPRQDPGRPKRPFLRDGRGARPRRPGRADCRRADRLRPQGPGRTGRGRQRRPQTRRQLPAAPLPAHRGRCLIVVRPHGKAGTIELHATAKGLTEAMVKITTGS